MKCDCLGQTFTLHPDDEAEAKEIRRFLYRHLPREANMAQTEDCQRGSLAIIIHVPQHVANNADEIPVQAQTKPSQQYFFGTTCLIELRQLAIDLPTNPGQLNHNLTYGQLLIQESKHSPVRVMNLSLYRMILMQAIMQRSIQNRDVFLTTGNIKILRCYRQDLEHAFEEMGRTLKVQHIGEKVIEEIRNYRDFINHNLTRMGLPELLLGNSRTGYWLNTSPCNICITPAPSFACFAPNDKAPSALANSGNPRPFAKQSSHDKKITSTRHHKTMSGKTQEKF